MSTFEVKVADSSMVIHADLELELMTKYSKADHEIKVYQDAGCTVIDPADDGDFFYVATDCASHVEHHIASGQSEDEFVLSEIAAGPDRFVSLFDCLQPKVGVAPQGYTIGEHISYYGKPDVFQSSSAAISSHMVSERSSQRETQTSSDTEAESIPMIVQPEISAPIIVSGDDLLLPYQDIMSPTPPQFAIGVNLTALRHSLKRKTLKQDLRAQFIGPDPLFSQTQPPMRSIDSLHVLSAGQAYAAVETKVTGTVIGSCCSSELYIQPDIADSQPVCVSKDNVSKLKEQ